MPRLPDEIMRFLIKGTFPLLDGAGVRLWDMMLSILEDDCRNGKRTAIKEIEEEQKKKFRGEVWFTGVMTVNKVEIDTGQDFCAAFLGAAHARLCKDYSVAITGPVQALIQRVRVLVENYRLIKRSKVVLTMNPDTSMGLNMQTTTLTFLPDMSLGVNFGSVPDQEAIARVAVAWRTLKRRRFESKYRSYGATQHYVLAHLLNHNLNGSGSNPLNLIPFWGGANTEMAKKVEVHVKQLVLFGATVKYNITSGPAVGMTPGRIAAKAACTDDVQREIIDWEQYLPEYFQITCDVLEVTGSWTSIVNVPIYNYVPETVPYLM